MKSRNTYPVVIINFLEKTAHTLEKIPSRYSSDFLIWPLIHYVNRTPIVLAFSTKYIQQTLILLLLLLLLLLF